MYRVIKAADNSICEYDTNFHLSCPVNDYDAAYAYLTDDDMTKYLKDDIEYSATSKYKRYPDSLKPDDIVSIRWELVDEESGYIYLVTSRALNDEELDGISSWVQGQNSDGLGEGFEQQEFAQYYDEEYMDDEDEWYDDGWVDMASFDWKHNDYKFQRVG